MTKLNNKSFSRKIGFDGNELQEFALIQVEDASYCGFGALMLHALNGIVVALKHNWLPIINFDKNSESVFFDEEKGNNVWEYYFEPVCGISSAEFYKLKHSSQIEFKKIHTLSEKDFLPFFGVDTKGITHFWNTTEPLAWTLKNRERCRHLCQEYIKPKEHILQIVNQFRSRYFTSSSYILGVHIRGTDFNYAKPTSLLEYFNAISEHVGKIKNEDWKIFLATDQEQFVDEFRSEFGDRIITYDSIRSLGNLPICFNSQVNPYQRGEDVLIDILLLSKCNYLFKCASAVGELALWLAPQLKSTDFALQSTWTPNNSVKTYDLLNISEKNDFINKLSILSVKFKRYLLDLILIVGRLVLPLKMRKYLWKNIGRWFFFYGAKDARHKENKK